MFNKKMLGVSLWLALTGVFAGANADAQSLSGKVTDAETNEALPGANVVIVGSGKGVSTNNLGNYYLTGLPTGQVTIKVSFVGYETVEKAISVGSDEGMNFSLSKDLLLDEGIIVSSTRANEKTPMTFSTISNKEIKAQNLGQDMPMLVNWSPSVVTTSDAGAGVGYTGIRIRGSDATRINVTINGVPLNDSESHGTFWVNTPDLASSTNNIQIQRGVGASTNGAGAFGATINLQTSMPSTEGFGEINNSFGSYGTRKHNIVYNTGLIKDHWSFEGRLSKIASDGYIDRASSDLQSYFLSGGYYGKRTIVKALVFGGKEVTYQSWWGTPEARLNNDEEGMQEVIANNGYSQAQADNLLNSGRTFNYYQYDNEVDNYQQDHYQLHLTHQLSKEWSVNGALHYTYGRGYYEQYREGDDFSDYGLDPIIVENTTIESTDLIRRRWLDNDFYGFTYSINYSGDKWQTTLGGGLNVYDGDHFGEIIWARYASNSEIRDRYYESNALKKDFNSYLKANYQLTDRLNAYGDLQIRTIGYTTEGNDSDLATIDVDKNFFFFNPKAGLTYALDGASQLYASYSVAHREPIRSDFIDAPAGKVPSPEMLGNWEAGYKNAGKRYSAGANLYLMDYRDQLVLTGEVNDVGSSVRTNVADSYRAGIELQGSLQLSNQFTWNANLTVSRNKIKEFTEVLYDYGTNFDEYNEIRNSYKNTDISFSPNVIVGSQLFYRPIPAFEAGLLTKYVGRQYMDNTQMESRSIDPYFVNDLRFTYEWKLAWVERIGLSLLVNNVFSTLYSSNGYTFGYFGGAYEVRENYYYPQATRNFLAALSVRF
jgi:iron complex outermembrane recepter protein